MKRFSVAFLAAILAVSCMKERIYPTNANVFVQPGVPLIEDRSLVYYWNFNDVQNLLKPVIAENSGSSLIFNGLVGVGVYDAVNPGTSLNARNGDIDASGLRLRNPAANLLIQLPTNYLKDVIFSFAVQRSNSGAQLNIVTYTIDGVNYISDGLKANLHQVNTDWTVYSYDFTNITAVNNNPNFKIKIEFANGNTGISGNNRYDNICVDAHRIPLPKAELMHYWDFNDSINIQSLLPVKTLPGTDNGKLAYDGNYDYVSPGSLLNARQSSSDGGALRLRNPATGYFTIQSPTTGYKNILLSYAISRTSKGAQNNLVSYSVDGTNFSYANINGNSYVVDTTYKIIALDFSKIDSANNNPNFKVRLEFSNGNTGTSGNNRIDNLTVEGIKQ